MVQKESPGTLLFRVCPQTGAVSRHQLGTWGKSASHPVLHCGSSPACERVLYETHLHTSVWEALLQQTSLGSLPQTGLVGKALGQPYSASQWENGPWECSSRKTAGGSAEREIIPYPSSQEKVNKFSQMVKKHFNETTEGQELVQGLIKLPARGQHGWTLDRLRECFFPKWWILSSPCDCFLLTVRISKVSFASLLTSHSSLHYLFLPFLSPPKRAFQAVYSRTTPPQNTPERCRGNLP